MTMSTVTNTSLAVVLSSQSEDLHVRFREMEKYTLKTGLLFGQMLYFSFFELDPSLFLYFPLRFNPKSGRFQPFILLALNKIPQK